MKRFIEVEKGVREHLQKLFGVSSVCVWKALNYESDTDLCRRIRKAALVNKGVRRVVCDEMECVHDSDGVMRQMMPNGVVIEFVKNAAGDVRLVKDGLTLKRWTGVTLGDIEGIQREALCWKTKA